MSTSSLPGMFIRFALKAIIGTCLLLLLVSAVRAAYLHYFPLKQAAAAITTGNHQQAATLLRRAEIWSHAYPALHRRVQHAHARLASETLAPAPPVPPVPTRASPLDKLLFLPDLLTNLMLEQMHPPAPTPASTPEPAPAPEPLPEPPDASPKPVATPPPQTASQGPSPDASPPSPPASQETVAAEAPPAPEPAPEPAYDPDAMWGVVQSANAPIYDQRGTRLRTLPPGSLIDVVTLRESSAGTVVIGTLHSRLGRYRHAVLRLQDVELYKGRKLTDTTLETRALASRRAELIGALEAREHALLEAAQYRNPYQREFHDLLRRYRKLSKEANMLTAQYDETTGGRRLEIANRLRELKNEQAVITPEYRDLKHKRDTWNRQNPVTAPDPAMDPKIQSLQRELDEINAQFQP